MNKWIEFCKKYAIDNNVSYKQALMDCKKSNQVGSGNGLKPFFCRIGNKSFVADKIINQLPKHTIYVEPFIGSGAIFFKKNKSNIEVINDLDKGLIDGYRLLKKRIIIKKDYNKPKSLEELQLEVDKIPTNDEERLYQKVLTYCNTFSSIAKGKLYKPNTHVTKMNNLDAYRERLKDTIILNQDYKKVIKKYDSLNTLFYLDPPYEDSKRLYEHGDFCLMELKKVLDKIKGKFILSLNDSPNVRDIFKTYNIQEIKEGITKIIHTKKTKRTDLLIKNF